MFDRIVSLLVALSLALLVWLYARSRDQETLDNVPVPVQITLAAGQAEHYNVELTGPSQVMASFTGPPPRIRDVQAMLQRQELQVTLTLNVPEERLNEPRYSDTVHVEPSDIHAPAGVSVVMVEGRNRIPVTLHRLVERRLPVRFEHGQEEPGTPVILEPATVLVRGPQEVLDRARSIPTQPSELPARPVNAPLTAAAVGRVPLVQELEGRPVRVTPNRVTVRVPPLNRKVYDLPDVPIHFLCPANFGLRPRFYDERMGRIHLRLQGPHQEEPPKVYVFIDLTRGRFVSGLNHEPLQLQLPKDFQLTDGPLPVRGFNLEPADTPVGMEQRGGHRAE
jgi:hypothetical protein